MESHHDKSAEKVHKPSQTEAADKLISKKKFEKEAEGRQAVQQSAEGVQSEVADLMGGVEAPKEAISEKKGESGEKGDIKGGGMQDDSQKTQAAAAFAARRGMPSEEIMIKKIRTAIGKQIKHEIKKAKKLEKHLTTGSAQEYNTAVARVRGLQEVLKSLVTTTLEAIKTLYFKYFSASGQRKSLDEL